jgi:hypothetical protein
LRRLEPAAIGSATVETPGLRCNRVQHERPVDDSLTLIRIDDAAGGPLAALVSSAAHPITVGGTTVMWDAEYIAPVRDVLESAHPGMECVFLQGCAGDLAPFDWWFGDYEASPHGYECRDRLGREIGEAALGSCRRTTGDVRVAADRRTSTFASAGTSTRRRRSELIEESSRAAAPWPEGGGPRCTR